MRKLLALVLSSLLVATPAFADRTMYAPVRLAPTATAGTILFGDGTAAAPSMSFSADTNTGIYRAGSDRIAIATGGAFRFGIDEAGFAYFGNAIVSSTPTQGTISGTLASGTNTAGADLRIQGGSSTGTGAGGAVIFRTSPTGSTGSATNASTERMRITSAGEVGIGETSPGSRLQVNTGAAGTKGLILKAAASQTANLFEAQDSSGNVLGLIDSGGRIGLGTNAPSAKLHITSSTNAECALNASGDSSNSIHARLPGRIIIGAPGNNYPSITYNAIPTQTAGFKTFSKTSTDTSWGIKLGEANAIKFQYAASAPAGSTFTFTDLMTITSTGQIQVGDGTAAAPVLSFSSDTDTGIYRNAADQLVFGTGGAGKVTITATGQVVVGQGHNGGTPVAGSVIGAAGSGTNIAGANLTIAGGNSTGTGAGGELIFQTAAAGSSGSAANTLTERMRVKINGQVRFIPLAADPAGAEAGDVYYNSSTNKLKVYNGTSWIDLH